MADTENFKVRKVSLTGVVTSLAGRNLRADGAVDGQGSEARFYKPSGIAVSRSGLVYVMDMGANAGNYNALRNTGIPSFWPIIRKVSPVGAVTTLRLGPEATNWDFYLGSIAVDSAENLYVIGERTTGGDDAESRTETAVLKILPSGNVGVLASLQIRRTEPRLKTNEPYFLRHVAVDSSDNVFVVGQSSDGSIPYRTFGDFGTALTRRSTIRKVTPSGVVTNFFEDSLPVSSDTPLLQSFAVDAAGDVLAAYSSGLIRRINASGQEVGSLKASSSLGIAAGAAGSIYFVDAAEIKKADVSGVTTLAGKNRSLVRQNILSECGDLERGTGVGICTPGALATDALGNILFMDSYVSGGGQVLPSKIGVGLVWPSSYVLGQLRRVSKDGVVSGLVTDQYGLGGVAIDSVGNIYVGERLVKSTSSCSVFLCGDVNRGGTVWKMSPTGAISKVWTSDSVTPERIVLDGDGNLYVGTTHLDHSGVNQANETMVKLSPDGRELGQLASVETILGSFREFTVDAQGNLIVAESFRVRKISPGGVVTDFGLENSPGAVDGQGSAARFSEIRGLAFDPAGNIFVADRYNHAIRKISPTGMVTTVVGKLGSAGIALGDLPGSLYQPLGLAFDAEGLLYISSGDAILKVKLQ